ncbi:MAG: polyprenyl synthetase family protein, partial [Opitutales bacterium]
MNGSDHSANGSTAPFSMSNVTPTTQPDFAKLVQFRRQLVDKAIDATLPAADAPPSHLHEAIRYSVQAGGKRLRPMLVLAGHALFPSERNPMPAAIAVECLHTYSLIHDDLPAMDDSDLRRGQPTCHKAFGEATAILAGDALLTMAFQILADSYADDPAVSVALSRVLSTVAGSSQLIGGQMDDLLAEKKPDPSPELISSIHARKTAALIAASLEMGACLGDRSEDFEFIARARSMGLSLGHAFQAVDDLLDATAKSADLGKTTAQDAVRGKCTLVTFHGLEEARR